MGVSAAIFYAIVIACPIIYGIRQLVLFIIKQVKAHKAWNMRNMKRRMKKSYIGE